jgi:maltooligosyltrehalose trehalohydrolase
MSIRSGRRLPVGAEPEIAGVHFRVWAPKCRRLRVLFEDESHPTLELGSEEPGYFAGFASGATAGMNYWLLLDDSSARWPDPVSRFQPFGPDGPSQIADLDAYAWRDADFRGLTMEGQVLYEMHVGTFTTEGTWQAATRHLPELARLGITALEIMPIAEFPGAFGWSYDGTQLFAPSHLYGTPEDLCRFVDEAHRLGLGVILDVVYNHLSLVGEKYLSAFSQAYVSKRHKSEWGAAINFDGENSAGVREFFRSNVRQWISGYHFDGLRIDATQAFCDESPEHILLELSRTAHRAGGDRKVLVVGENEPQQASLMRPAERGGHEFDAVWNDDFHHSAMVRLTGRREAYYTDYNGSAEELLASIKWGYLFQGQRYAWQKARRGTPALDIEAPRFVNYLQNHDQLANSARGKRISALTSPGRLRAMTALLLLGPQTPLLFQGQEFAASSPFLYFSDCADNEARKVTRGRAQFLSQFLSLAGQEMQSRLPNPCDRHEFESSKLDHSERLRHGDIYAMHGDLLALRRDDAAFRARPAQRIDGTALSADALAIRFSPDSEETRLLVANFGCDLRFESISNPLMAPPEAARWAVLWSSDDPRYGGGGTYELETSEGWRIPGEAAVLLHPVYDA